MPAAGDDVDKLLADQKAVEERRKALIEELLHQKEAAIKEFDEKLTKLGYQVADSKPKRSHHAKRPAAQPSAMAKGKDKPAD